MSSINLLFVNSCLSVGDKSRTKILCNTFIDVFKINKTVNIEVAEVNNNSVLPLTVKDISKRDEFSRANMFSDSMFDLANQFAKADYIVVGAPYWDLSFPAALKAYVENIMVTGLTFKYTESGLVGLCKAKKLVYITTAGGYIGDCNFGYDYIKGVANMMGIENTEFIAAEGLDIFENNPDEIMTQKIEEIKTNIQKYSDVII